MDTGNHRSAQELASARLGSAYRLSSSAEWDHSPKIVYAKPSNSYECKSAGWSVRVIVRLCGT
eukprot:scaffold460012_cov14-Prasinocladus_malaysianus.AAC.1